MHRVDYIHSPPHRDRDTTEGVNKADIHTSHDKYIPARMPKLWNTQGKKVLKEYSPSIILWFKKCLSLVFPNLTKVCKRYKSSLEVCSHEMFLQWRYWEDKDLHGGYCVDMYIYVGMMTVVNREPKH